MTDPGREGVFRPESVRFHPLTRVVRRDGDRLAIEVHVELFDAWGHPVKGLGILRFEVIPGMPGGIGNLGGGEAGSALRAEIDLTNPDAASVRYYDSATRTYRLILEGDNPAPATPISLTVTFIGLDERVLRDTFTPGEGPRMSEPDETDEQSEDGGTPVDGGS